MSNKSKRVSINVLISQNDIDNKLLMFLLFVLGFIPIIMRATLLDFVSPVIMNGVLDTGRYVDFFNYYKFLFLVILTLIIVSLYLYKVVVLKIVIPINRMNLFFISITLILLISVLISDYKTISLFGIYNRYEGSIAFFCYLLLFFISSNISYNRRIINYIFCIFGFLLITNTILGVLNFYEFNTMDTALVRKLLLPPNFYVKDGGYISSTFNNPNYASGVGSVFFCIFLAATLLTCNRKRWLNIGLTCLSFVLLLSTLSTSGFLTILIMTPFILILFILKYKFTKEIISSLLLIFVICSAVYYPMYVQKPKVWRETFGFLSNTQSVILVADEKSTLIEQEFNLPKPGIGTGNGRVYIWAKTLELLKQKPFFGYGMDTLGLYFDQNDPAKVANLKKSELIVTKPHNYYLQIAFGIGLTGLVNILLMFVTYGVSFIRYYISNTEPLVNSVEFSLFAGWCAYLIQALFNDSVIGTSVIFWIIFGIGVGLLNQSIEENEVILGEST